MSAYHFFFFFKEKGKKKNNTHASASIIQRGGSRRPKNEGWSVWLGAHRSVYIRIRRKEQPKRKFRRSCCSDESLKMPAAHGRTDGRTDADMSKGKKFFLPCAYIHTGYDGFLLVLLLLLPPAAGPFSFLIFVALDMKKGMREKNKNKNGVRR